jgi:chromatin structure-remodeling complex subunit SFH1
MDTELAYEPYGVQIASSIQAQLDEHTGVAEVALLPPEHEAYFAQERHEGADLRVIVNLDVQIGTMHLVDRIEWDLTCSSITPEQFAKQLCADLGLGGEAVMIVSHAVHEEIFRLKREVIEVGLVGKNLVDLGKVQAIASGIPGRSVIGPKRLDSVWRDWNEAKMYGPQVEILTPEAIVSSGLIPCRKFAD